MTKSASLLSYLLFAICHERSSVDRRYRDGIWHFRGVEARFMRLEAMVDQRVRPLGTRTFRGIFCHD